VLVENDFIQIVVHDAITRMLKNQKENKTTPTQTEKPEGRTYKTKTGR